MSTLNAASLVAHMGKNPPAMQETGLRSLGQEDPLENGMAIHSSILVGKTPWLLKTQIIEVQGSLEWQFFEGS